MSKEYIDRELLENALEDENKNGNFVFTANWIMGIVDNLPTADVVPKSEVEWLYQTVDNYSQEVMYHDEIAKMKVDEAKAEVAREIFEELETKAPWFCENQTAYEHFNEELAELKKKYTEGL